MTQQEALDLIRRLLRAESEEVLFELVTASLPLLDSTFFSTAEAAVQQLEIEGKPAIAQALQSLTGRMLHMKTLI